ncbi:putative bifunctional diguanylate cyclase/phosphodiesterase [Sphingomonas sp. ac-8]|uniref:putative bifunctional diguanylate cyclase/phosphodiesterase n=1 Tax=Sphingomonas sp. ac-8 TaxID=3242977 RepID=UPI003A80014D
MRKAKIIADEAARLAAVAEYRLRDSEADAELQDLAQLAARRFDVPIALITLVREGDQLFLAKTGVEQQGTSRDISFCSHALASDDLLIVPDAALDPRFVDNPLVTGELGLRFYAGVPLRSVGGHVLGTLCILDRQPHSGVSARDRQTLRALGAQAVRRLEYLRLARARDEGADQFRKIAEDAPDAAVCADAAGRITFWNAAAAQLLGVDGEEALGSRLADFIPLLAQSSEGPAGGMGVPALVSLDAPVEVDARRADGSALPVELTLSAASGPRGSGWIAILRDLSARLRVDQLAFDAANRDGLTGLPNRTVLLERIAEHIARREQIHLLRVGLSGFDPIADASAGQTRDAMLNEVAQRLVESVSSGDTVTRLGNDEFAILRPAEAGESRSAALIVADRVIASLVVPVEVDKQRFPLGAQVGIACYPKHASSPDELMAAAGVALRQAQRDGRRTRRLYGEQLQHEAINDRDGEEELAQALARGEFELFYQPQVDLADGRMIGAEALIRWNHPHRGLLAPAEFLDRIEHGPFAAEVGTWVLETACSQAVAWRERAPEFRMSVNLFEAQFRRQDLATQVRAILDRTGLAPAGLELEVTEKVMLRHDSATLESLLSLHAQGIGVAFDDFGTGYASLSMLKSYPLTRLKVDRSFVQDIAADDTDALIVTAVATLGGGLGLDVLAEGIEEPAQADLLRASGCRSGQGYLFGRPMPARDFEAWMIAASMPLVEGLRA